MDDQYLDAFIRESEEAITELNNSLLDLEADPEDREAMDAIFRTAHTLKGNFGAMGFDDASDLALAHLVEQILHGVGQIRCVLETHRAEVALQRVGRPEDAVHRLPVLGVGFEVQKRVVQRGYLPSALADERVEILVVH